jgi:hypothetical protein
MMTAPTGGRLASPKVSKKQGMQLPTASMASACWQTLPPCALLFPL